MVPVLVSFNDATEAQGPREAHENDVVENQKCFLWCPYMLQCRFRGQLLVEAGGMWVVST